jgi:hypothetical protein
LQAQEQQADHFAARSPGIPAAPCGQIALELLVDDSQAPLRDRPLTRSTLADASHCQSSAASFILTTRAREFNRADLPPGDTLQCRSRRSTQTRTTDGSLSDVSFVIWILDNNFSKRSLRAQAIGRKNWLIVGLDLRQIGILVAEISRLGVDRRGEGSFVVVDARAEVVVTPAARSIPLNC